METELRESYPGSRIVLRKGGVGVFDVSCDGRRIYSKTHVRGERFPEEGEITRLIGQAKG